MIDKSFETISPKGSHLGPEKAFNVNTLRDEYGLEYRGGIGFDRFGVKMKKRVIKNVPETKVLILNVEGYVDSLENLKPLGGKADFNCKKLVDLKYFLQGGDLLIRGNTLYFTADRDICPDEFAVAAAARMLLLPYSKFIKFNKKIDGILECNFKVLDDSVRAEYNKDIDAYKVTYDLVATMKAPLQQLPFCSMRKPFPIKASQKLYKILKNFVEIPEDMDFLFGDKNTGNSIVVKSVESLQTDYAFLKNILHLESWKIGVFEFGALMAAFYPDSEKREILGNFFGSFGDRGLPYFARSECLLNICKLKTKPFPKVDYKIIFSLNSGIRDKKFMQMLEFSKQTFESIKANLKGGTTLEGDFHQETQFFGNEIYVAVFCRRFGNDVEMKKKIRKYEHLAYLDEFLQVAIDAFDTLIGIVKETMPYVDYEGGDSYYPGIKYFIEDVVRDAIKSDPMYFLDFGGSDERCEEIRNYARILVCGID